MNNLKELLWPINSSDFSLRHFGNKSDGGYVFPQPQVDRCDTIYSYGIGNEISVDEALANAGKRVMCYDHTIAKFPREINGCVFFKEGIAGKKTNDCDNFFAHREKNGDNDKNIILKMDVEGAEYDFFENFAGDKSKILAMTVEFHDVYFWNIRFVNSIEIILKDFYLIHHHGNNNSPVSQWGEFIYPTVPEISFINKNQVNNFCKKNIQYPIDNLDFNNNKDRNSIKINFLK